MNRTTGNALVRPYNPSPTTIKSNVKPEVAPNTNGKAEENPVRAPILKAIKLTGPGDTDIIRENNDIDKMLATMRNDQKLFSF